MNNDDMLRNMLQGLNFIAHQLSVNNESQLLALGRLLSTTLGEKKRIARLSEVEFRIFSQFGDDGIIQWLVSNLEFENNTFIEFGVENFRESNTRFLMMNNNWSGFVIDASEQNITSITNSEYFWRHELSAKAAFINCANINDLLSSCPFDKEVGILHVDLDGNDYWIWKEINVVSPTVVILEYNSVFGIDRPITIPYVENFVRTRHHHSNLYWGASLKALSLLAAQKGYAFVGCNSAGNNAYFVRKDKLNNVVMECPLEEGYVVSKYRESRNEEGQLTYLMGDKRAEAIRGMPVYNVVAERVENL